MRPRTATSFRVPASALRSSRTLISVVSLIVPRILRCTLVAVQLRYNVRMYPTPGQQIELAKAFGCARVVFNDGLRARQTARENGLPYVSDGDLSKQVITQT